MERGIMFVLLLFIFGLCDGRKGIHYSNMVTDDLPPNAKPPVINLNFHSKVSVVMKEGSIHNTPWWKGGGMQKRKHQEKHKKNTRKIFENKKRPPSNANPPVIHLNFHSKASVVIREARKKRKIRKVMHYQFFLFFIF